MSNTGFIKLHRKLLDWEWFDNPDMVKVWVYFLLKAKYKDCSWQGITIPRGSFIASLDTISKDCKLSVREVRTCLKRLKSTGELTIKTTNRYSMITICKYDDYNSVDSEIDKQSDKPTDNQETSQRQTKDKQTTIDKEYNNRNNRKKKKEEKLSDESKKKDSLDMSIVAADFFDVVKDWLEYKKERGEAYKPRGFVSFYNKLLELSGGDSVKAKKIVEESMANNYAGIFPLKEKNVSGLPVGMRLPGDRNGIIDESEGW